MEESSNLSTEEKGFVLITALQAKANINEMVVINKALDDYELLSWDFWGLDYLTVIWETNSVELMGAKPSKYH